LERQSKKIRVTLQTKMRLCRRGTYRIRDASVLIFLWISEYVKQWFDTSWSIKAQMSLHNILRQYTIIIILTTGDFSNPWKPYRGYESKGRWLLIIWPNEYCYSMAFGHPKHGRTRILASQRIWLRYEYWSKASQNIYSATEFDQWQKYHIFL
jgi:hypothetical protein